MFAVLVVHTSGGGSSGIGVADIYWVFIMAQHCAKGLEILI